jgi:predicted RNA binding protein YcfA (HicA-like mRNA interferase family)
LAARPHQRIAHVYKKPGQPGIISVPFHGNTTLKTGLQKKFMKQVGLTEGDL